MTAAQDCENPGVDFDSSEGPAYFKGYEAAYQEFAPLLEAARAYRDAHEHYMKNALDQGAWAKRVNAASDLARAARTFEGHVEEGAPATSEEGASE